MKEKNCLIRFFKYFNFIFAIKFVELIQNSDVKVHMHHNRITKTNIQSCGASTCSYILLTGIYEDQSFAYLHHDPNVYEGAQALSTLDSVLESIVTKLKADLIDRSSNKTFNGLNSVHLILAGGEQKDDDILRRAFSLMANPDADAQIRAKATFPNENVKILYDKLINNVTILKAITYVMSDEEEEQASSKIFFLSNSKDFEYISMFVEMKHQDEIIDPSSLSVYYDCVIDRGYLAIEWGSCKYFTHLAYMLFGLRTINKSQLTWNIVYDQIETIRTAIGGQSSNSALLDKALQHIPDDPIFDAVYTDLNLTS